MQDNPQPVSSVLVGLNRVGLAGLEQVFERADESGLQDRDELISFLMKAVSSRNYVPAGSEDQYRQAIWREYLRHRGEDIRHLYSEIDVVVRGERAEERDRLTAAISVALTEHELKPRFRYESADPAGVKPEVYIGGHLVLQGAGSQSAIRSAVRRRMHDW